MGLGEELVGKAYHLFLQRYGCHVAMRYRQVLTKDAFKREAGTRMTLAHQSMAGEAFLLHQFGA